MCGSRRTGRWPRSRSPFGLASGRTAVSGSGPGPSQIEHHVVTWLGAADERASIRGRFDRVRAVVDVAGDDGGLAAVADAGPAGPAHGDVAGLGELEQAGVVAAPWDGEIAACELDRRAASGLAGGWVGRPRRRRRDAGRQARGGPEGLRVDARGVDPHGGQAGADLVHERDRPAQVCLGASRRLELGEQRRGETTDVGEVAAFQVARAGTAVVHVRPHVRQRSKQRTRLGGEGVVATAARALQPPDLAFGVFSGERVEHGEDGGGPDAGADQQHRRVGAVEDEGASRRGDVELVADAQAGVQIATGGAGVLVLDRDPVVAGAGRSREGVVAQHRPLFSVGLESHGQVLAGARGRGRAAVGVLEADVDHGVALSLDSGHRQAAETRPGRRRAGWGQTGVAAAGVAVDQGAKGRLPARAEGRDPQRSEQLLARVSREIEQRVDFRDGHRFLTGGELDDLVARLDLALLEDAEVEARPAVRDEQGRNARVVHADAHAVTGDAGLRDFEDGSADPVAVADAHLVVAESLDREVLAELPVDEVASSELAFPVPVGVELVDEDGALLAAVTAQIPLAVPVDVELAHAARSGDGVLEDSREDRLALPPHVLWHADVDRQQSADHGRTRSCDELVAFSRDGVAGAAWDVDAVTGSAAAAEDTLVMRGRSGRQAASGRAVSAGTTPTCRAAGASPARAAAARA